MYYYLFYIFLDTNFYFLITFASMFTTYILNMKCTITFFLIFATCLYFFSCHCFKISFYHWFLVIWLLCSFLSVLGNFWASWILICIFITFEKKVIIYWILCIFHLLYLEDSNSTYTQLCEGVPLFTNAFSYFTVLSLSSSY